MAGSVPQFEGSDTINRYTEVCRKALCRSLRRLDYVDQEAILVWSFCVKSCEGEDVW